MCRLGLKGAADPGTSLAPPVSEPSTVDTTAYPPHCRKDQRRQRTGHQPGEYTHAHRRRIYLEDKAKVVTSDWGTESLPR